MLRGAGLRKREINKALGWLKETPPEVHQLMINYLTAPDFRRNFGKYERIFANLEGVHPEIKRQCILGTFDRSVRLDAQKHGFKTYGSELDWASKSAELLGPYLQEYAAPNGHPDVRAAAEKLFNETFRVISTYPPSHVKAAQMFLHSQRAMPWFAPNLLSTLVAKRHLEKGEIGKRVMAAVAGGTDQRFALAGIPMYAFEALDTKHRLLSLRRSVEKDREKEAALGAQIRGVETAAKAVARYAKISGSINRKLWEFKDVKGRVTPSGLMVFDKVPRDFSKKLKEK
jgi:hypothetical protein